MSFNTLQGSPVELEDFFDEADFDIAAPYIGTVALEPLVHVDLNAGEYVPPQSTLAPTAAFNSSAYALPAAFQSRLSAA